MTQESRTQESRTPLAPYMPRDRRSLAARHSDFRRQVEAAVTAQETMAIADLQAVSGRIKELRKRAGNPSQYDVAYLMGVKPRTYQSWENGEVEPDKAKYEKVAAWYSKKLGTKVTANWILFGQDDEPPLSSGPLEQLSSADRAQRLEEKVDALQGTVEKLVAQQTKLLAELAKERAALRGRQPKKKRSA